MSLQSEVLRHVLVLNGSCEKPGMTPNSSGGKKWNIGDVPYEKWGGFDQIIAVKKTAATKKKSSLFSLSYI